MATSLPTRHPGNLAVRDYRGASGNVSHGGTVNPSCNRKSRNGNPPPTAGRARLLSQYVLNGFSGVLISDFFAAYESVECAQQKCLIHLMRDINELVLKNPFNSELGSIANDFGVLLRGIVDSIDKWGLKSRHLRRHKRNVDRFFSKLESSNLTSEAALSLSKRFLKNRTKLFTFLDYDGVPWNNNNAEHAVRAFTRIRNCIATSTVKGTKEYAILLSIQQTLKYRNIEFLDFLRSGRPDIKAFA